MQDVRFTLSRHHMLKQKRRLTLVNRGKTGDLDA